ncbi:3-oxoacyl-[acyl-carrier-protein] reductase FabG-like [Oppia nitens]|uniref:3-oxoacyl-[acyl-carrier-protein] reductase FabG-like n=1 Tax=Oppia nitens TaxID=1686743 RepID=UPI0023DA8644|nr:3-oxoacyl-[acyl-carrier-protein] reductase FabG-like [Oppia nitens]
MSIKYDFTGKVVLITGSSSGIGAVTAVQFAKSGAMVVVTGRRSDKLAEVAKQCTSVSPKKLKPLEVVADVTKDQDIKRLVETTVQHFGRLDILVNNAGAGTNAPLSDPEFYDKYQKTFQLNLNSMVLLTHLSIDHLAKTRGNIVNISSIFGLRAFSNYAPYCMAKCSIDMFTKCCAAELGRKHIRVNSINPGPIKTEFLTAMGLPIEQSDALFDGFGSQTPVGRAGLPDEVGDAILYLSSDHSKFITGSQLIIDGGSVAGNTMVNELDKLVQ